MQKHRRKQLKLQLQPPLKLVTLTKLRNRFRLREQKPLTTKPSKKENWLPLQYKREQHRKKPRKMPMKLGRGRGS